MADAFRLFKKMSKSKKKSHTAADTSSAAPDPQPSGSQAPAAAEEERTPVNNRNSLAMDEELLRMRDEISRVTIERERREMEAARAGADMIHYKEDLARITAIKTEVDHENRKLQAEVASLERERARIVSEVDRLKEDLERTKAKLVDKKRVVAELKAELKRGEEERERLERSAKDREQTWQTIRRDVTSKRDDAIRDSCKMRRENEKLKLRINKLKAEKSNILLRMWEKKQLEAPKAKYSAGHTVVSDGKEQQEPQRRPRDEGLQAKVLSLELQLFRQARLVELLLDVIQTHDPQFTTEQRADLTSAFADAGSIPELLSRKLKLI